ncbi:basic blue protein-like [Panicum virgatum]|uniref:basic blue protein-like n=1 Tax=Panicum virgatum TaxID=38727 RepID=UPI0019D60F92|nr:basic blue protein-like [Panicum virgatum]
MTRGGGGASASDAIVAMAFTIACFCCSILAADAGTTYYVGDSNGWSFGSPSWPNGKHFHAGDTLVFRYVPWIHNVVAVDEDGYNGCTTPPGSRTYTSGNDRVTLARGDTFFLCTRYGHCNLGMKLVVYAA